MMQPNENDGQSERLLLQA